MMIAPRVTQPIMKERTGLNQDLLLAESALGRSRLTIAPGASTTPAGLPRRGPRSVLGSVNRLRVKTHPLTQVVLTLTRVRSCR